MQVLIRSLNRLSVFVFSLTTLSLVIVVANNSTELILCDVKTGDVGWTIAGHAWCSATSTRRRRFVSCRRPFGSVPGASRSVSATSIIFRNCRCASAHEREKFVLQAKLNRGTGFKKEVEELIECKDEMFPKNYKMDERLALNCMQIGSFDMGGGKLEYGKKMIEGYVRQRNLFTAVATLGSPAVPSGSKVAIPNIPLYCFHMPKSPHTLLSYESFAGSTGSFDYPYNRGPAVYNASSHSLVSPLVGREWTGVFPMFCLKYPDCINFNTPKEYNGIEA
eukprot:TRINITY_DN7804_c0_g1_i3.p1 TRINITY_DN7804_c0_g1~~TRINITY_DN7804_c0_g1_i3.p1  ORF type:complete len:278 (-),score=-15.47 TRINITY_DN7804_c0_g1_i3:190-1023(-)